VIAPDFIIGGAPRSGTTSLAETLDRHPAITLARPTVPEPKIFLLPAASDEERLARYTPLFAGAAPGAVLVEKSTNYFESETACAAIRATLPDVRMIFVLREPAARAHSNWLWSRKNGFEDLSFEDALAASGGRADPLAETHPHARPFDYLERGRYATLARPWLDAFGRDRVRFVLLEDLVGDRREHVLDELQRFVEVESRDLGPPPAELGNEARGTGPPLAPETEAMLRGHYEDEVRAFAEQAGVDVGSWRYA
jgi:hypothetical protein